ncbi:GNAT family N-acetyltransferase [Natrialbaceae archaeon AArc-T1-2]|uniref:GNAT family N-acetyltransferase n=1 Tax=Natrialbaceae archaeon AArc-T1-2 TaxID=3053904 RepID=UPI00255B3167|nr:GNAT family N-acetyltransferase [Natrialbaceae archaeon AArc-T1-2]WIV68221.1 GNAT family N-acetyltransferase [Natrialbaceae archaeon AArc-T1-2]
MEYREATRGDLEAIGRIARASWEADYPEILSRETAADEAVEEWYGRETIERELEAPGSVVLVAEDDDEVVGFAHAVVTGGEATILRLYVHPERRREGIGREVLGRTIREADNRAADRITAMVLSENDLGNAFYRSAGFEPVETGETTIGGESYEETTYELGSWDVEA